MQEFFQKTKKLKPISRERMLEIVEGVCPSAYLEAGRPWYLAPAIEDVREFLLYTQIDRYRWREALAADSTVEVVCATFSWLLGPLFEQERLRAGLLYPLTVGRARLISHSMNIFVSAQEACLLIEPQNDQVVVPAVYCADPNRTVQSCMFV